MELFAAIGRGEVKAVWIMGTNPVVSLPDSHAVSQALAACPLVIVSDVAAQTDTGRFAHIRFPALAWGEKNGTVTNSERRSPSAQLSAAAGGGESGLVDHRQSGPGAGVSRGVCLAASA